MMSAFQFLISSVVVNQSIGSCVLGSQPCGRPAAFQTAIRYAPDGLVYDGSCHSQSAASIQAKSPAIKPVEMRESRGESRRSKPAANPAITVSTGRGSA